MNIRPTRIAKELSRVRVSLRTLDKVLRRLTPVLTADARTKVDGAVKPVARVSSKARATMVLQGRYMGYMRQLDLRQKTQVRKIRQAKGVKEAIARARDLAQT